MFNARKILKISLLTMLMSFGGGLWASVETKSSVPVAPTPQDMEKKKALKDKCTADYEEAKNTFEREYSRCIKQHEESQKLIAAINSKYNWWQSYSSADQGEVARIETSETKLKTELTEAYRQLAIQMAQYFWNMNALNLLQAMQDCPIWQHDSNELGRLQIALLHGYYLLLWTDYKTKDSILRKLYSFGLDAYVQSINTLADEMKEIPRRCQYLDSLSKNPQSIKSLIPGWDLQELEKSRASITNLHVKVQDVLNSLESEKGPALQIQSMQTNFGHFFALPNLILRELASQNIMGYEYAIPRPSQPRQP